MPVERLISKQYAAERGRLIDTQVGILKWDTVPSFGSLSGDTVYVAAVDRDGNAASLIQSLYGAFGACVVAGNTGVILQNRGAYFSLDPDHPNRLEPGKIPLHTLIASIAKRDGKLWSVLGCMGADGQPQIQMQLYSAMIDFGLDIQEAIEMPRFLSGRFALGEARDTLHIESRFPGSDDRGARTARPRDQSMGRLERNGRSRPRHHDRPAERHVERRFRPAQRWGGDRVLGHWINGPLSRAPPLDGTRRQASISINFALRACGDKVCLSARFITTNPTALSRKLAAGLKGTLCNLRFVSSRNWCDERLGRALMMSEVMTMPAAMTTSKVGSSATGGIVTAAVGFDKALPSGLWFARRKATVTVHSATAPMSATESHRLADFALTGVAVACGAPESAIVPRRHNIGMNRRRNILHLPRADVDKSRGQLAGHLLMHRA